MGHELQSLWWKGMRDPLLTPDLQLLCSFLALEVTSCYIIDSVLILRQMALHYASLPDTQGYTLHIWMERKEP